jgi:hypothetical protein
MEPFNGPGRRAGQRALGVLMESVAMPPSSPFSVPRGRSNVLVLEWPRRPDTQDDDDDHELDKAETAFIALQVHR